MDTQQHGGGGRFTCPPGAQAYDTGRDAGNGRDAGDSPESPGEAWKAAFSSLGEAKEYASYFVGAKWDAVKVSLRNLAVYAVLGLLGMAVGMAVLATAAVLLLLGLAAALGDLLWDKWWAGALIVSLLILGGLAVGVVVGMKWMTGSSRKRTVDKYERRQREQRHLYGHDVRERATREEFAERVEHATEAARKGGE